MPITPYKKILFQGDSITDCGRNREFQDEANNNQAMGLGYPKMIAAQLLSQYPVENLYFFNRGDSGNRVVDLYARWKVDCLNSKPDLLSILIGVNDTWHGMNEKRPNGVEPERYETIYRMLLEWTKQELHQIQLVICEPFVLKCGVVEDAWITEMDIRRSITKKLAKEFDAIYIPFQNMFDQAVAEAPAEYWAKDGVHPTLAGHQRMADLWLSTVTR